jgi:hypothetical protein
MGVRKYLTEEAKRLARTAQFCINSRRRRGDPAKRDADNKRRRALRADPAKRDADNKRNRARLADPAKREAVNERNRASDRRRRGDSAKREAVNERNRTNQHKYRTDPAKRKVMNVQACARAIIRHKLVRRQFASNLPLHKSVAKVEKAICAAIYAHTAGIGSLTGEDWHVDHIMPLDCLYVSGLHRIKNLRPLPGPENSGKSNLLLRDLGKSLWDDTTPPPGVALEAFNLDWLFVRATLCLYRQQDGLGVPSTVYSVVDSLQIDRACPFYREGLTAGPALRWIKGIEKKPVIYTGVYSRFIRLAWTIISPVG